MIFPIRLASLVGLGLLAVHLPGAMAENEVTDTTPPTPVESVTPTEEIPFLGFDEFFKMPVGRYGLEMTDKLKGLDGKKVRLRGYMVKEDRCRAGHAHNPEDEEKEVVKGRFMLSPAPVMVSYACFGTSDDLFPQTVFVRVSELANRPIPYTASPLELVGTLSVGPSEEPDDRISQVRLTLDPLPAEVIAKMSSAFQTADSHSDHAGCKHGPDSQ